MPKLKSCKWFYQILHIFPRNRSYFIAKSTSLSPQIQLVSHRLASNNFKAKWQINIYKFAGVFQFFEWFVVLPTLNVHIFCLLKSIYLVTFWNLFLHPLRVCKLLENKDKLNFYRCRRAEAPWLYCPRMSQNAAQKCAVCEFWEN